MNTLQQTLSVWRGTALILNIVIGAGLLTLPGLAIRQIGDYAFAAWVLCAAISIPLLLVFILLGRRYPHAGGIAHFAEQSLGRHAYGVASLLFLGAVLFGLPAIALTGGHYLSAIVGLDPVLFAGLLIVLATLTNAISAGSAGKILSFIASGILGALVFLIVIGLMGIDTNRIGDAVALPPPDRFFVLLVPFMMIFFAFTGWEVAAGTAEEFKNPQRDFPRAMGLSFVIACVLYLFMALIAQGLDLGANNAYYEAPFVLLATQAMGRWGGVFVSGLAGLIVFANLGGAIWAVSRMVFSLSRERILPAVFQQTTNGSPMIAVITTAAALLLVLMLDKTGLLRLDQMLAIAGQNFLILYAVTAVALFRLSNVTLERFLAATVIATVALLIVFQGINLGYPLSLAIVGWLVAKREGASAPD